MPPDLSSPTERSPLSTWSIGVLGILAIGALDFFSGVEMRVFPLYYLPLALLAWRSGRAGAVLATLLCGAVWVVSNSLAGLRYTLTSTWFVNTAMQTASFATVGLLIAVVRDSLVREQGLSRRDPLSGMLNRKGFYEEAMRLIALCRRTGRPLTVAYIDLDNFKAINDQLGHERGDEVLRHAADALEAAIRPSDVGARLGGDEFVLLFPELGGSEAAVALERVHASLVEALPKEPVEVTASIGAATFVQPPENIEDMVRASDAQMYRAKADGKNRIELHVFEPGREPAAGSGGPERGN